MKKLAFLGVAMLAILGLPAPAATISLLAPTTVSGSSFDVVVEAQDLFANRDPLTDLLISYGFDVSVSDPSIFSFTGATSGPLFDPATTEPGTDVFGAAFGQNGFGVEPGAADPLTLATLHFQVLGLGSSDIVISSDLNNLFQGLQFLNAPFQESIAGTVSVAAVPEPTVFLFSGAGLIGLAFLRRLRR